MKHLPNIFTLLNLFFGCLAIVYALQLNISFYYADNGELILGSMQSSLWMASFFIGIAAIIDFLDGFLARALNANSDLGKQLDSLSDVVSFGVAPAVIFYQILRIAIMHQDNGIEESVVWTFPAFLFSCCAAYRLARFNLTQSSKSHFSGVPTPAAALCVASLPLILYYNYFNGSVNTLLLNKWTMYVVILLISYLMVSNVPMLSMKSAGRSITVLLILAVAAVILGFFLQWLAVPAIFILYILLSLITIRKTEINNA